MPQQEGDVLFIIGLLHAPLREFHGLPAVLRPEGAAGSRGKRTVSQTRGSHLGLSSVTRRGQGSPGKTQLRSAWRAAFTPSSTWRAQRRAAAATAAAAREKMAAGSRPLRLKPTPQAARARMEKRPVNRLDSAKSTAADSGVLAMGKDLPVSRQGTWASTVSTTPAASRPESAA